MSAENRWLTAAGMRSSATKAKNASGSRRRDCSFCVLALVDPEDVHVQLAAAFELERDLLADEAVRQVREPQRALDRVVVGERDEVHPAPPRPLVHLERVGIALAAQVLEHRDTGGARVPGMDVQVAAHQLGTVALHGYLPW